MSERTLELGYPRRMDYDEWEDEDDGTYQTLPKIYNRMMNRLLFYST
jgi:hypothetical protein